MKIILFMLFASLWIGAFASTASWEYVFVVNGSIGETQIHLYDLWGSVVSGDSYGETWGPFLGYADESGFHLKQHAYGLHKEDVGPSIMLGKDNLWVLANYGELLSLDTIEDAMHIDLCRWDDETASGGTLVGNPNDFYLGFMVSSDAPDDDSCWFGWYHVSLDENLEMALLDAGIGLYGESVRVGIGSIPEPTGAILLLVGVAFLNLRRRMCRVRLTGAANLV